MLSSNRRNRLGFGAFAALLLCVGIPVVQSRHSASVRDERTLYGHRQLNEAPLLLRVYDEAWKLAAGSTLSSGESVTTLETTCKKRKSGKGKGKKGGKGNKGSGPDDIVREPVGGKGKKGSGPPDIVRESDTESEESETESGKGSGKGKSKKSKSGKGSKKSKKSKKSKLPYCDDDDDIVREPTPSVPTPTAPSPTPDIIREPTAPVRQPPDIVRESVTICDEFFSGNATRNTDSVPFKVFFTIETDGTRPTSDVLEDIHDILRNNVAADLLGCSRLSSRRLQTSSSNQVVNIDFSNIVESTTGSPESNVKVIELDGAVFYVGSFPQGILETVLAAIANADFSGIEGLTALRSISIRDRNGNEFSVGDEPEPEPIDNDRGTDIDAVQRPDATQRSTVSAGGYVGVAIAGLVVLLVALFVITSRRRKNRSRDGGRLKHQQFDDQSEEDNMRVMQNVSTDEESDAGSSFRDTRADRGEGLARVVMGDENSIWETESRIRVSPESKHGVEVDILPNERKGRGEIRFIKTGDPPGMEKRKYVAADTVDL